jgi:hypothetical protein
MKKPICGILLGNSNDYREGVNSFLEKENLYSKGTNNLNY